MSSSQGSAVWPTRCAPNPPPTPLRKPELRTGAGRPGSFKALVCLKAQYEGRIHAEDPVLYTPEWIYAKEAVQTALDVIQALPGSSVTPRGYVKAHL